MLEQIKAFIAWVKDVLDSQASPSFGRVGCTVVILTMLFCAVFLIVKGHDLTIVDIPWGWVSVVAILWGGSKGPDMLAALKNGGRDKC